MKHYHPAVRVAKCTNSKSIFVTIVPKLHHRDSQPVNQLSTDSILLTESCPRKRRDLHERAAQDSLVLLFTNAWVADNKFQPTATYLFNQKPWIGERGAQRLPEVIESASVIKFARLLRFYSRTVPCSRQVKNRGWCISNVQTGFVPSKR